MKEEDLTELLADVAILLNDYYDTELDFEKDNAVT